MREESTNAVHASAEVPTLALQEQPARPTGIEAMVCDLIAKRQALGRSKYGFTVADNPLTLRQWLEHAMLEALDQAIYLRRAIAEIDAQEALITQVEPSLRFCPDCGEGVTFFCRSRMPFDCRQFPAKETK